MRLHELHIKNFRKLKNCRIKFRDTTFLIGPNNAGKSSVFSVLNHLHKSSNLDREDYSKEFNAEDESYTYENEVEVIAEYHNVPDAAHGWLGFKGRVISSQEQLDGETGNSIAYKKVWNLNQSKPRIFMKEYPRTRSPLYAECTKVSDLAGEHYSEVFLKQHFGEANFDKNLTVTANKLNLLDLPECWDIQADEEATWVENPGGIPGNVQSKLPRIVVIPAESCIAELTSSGGALFSLLGDLFEQVRSNSPNYTQAQTYLNKLAAELNPSDGTTDFGQLINDLNGMVGNLFPDSSVHVSATLDVPDKSIKPQFNVEMESNVKTAVNY
jgi:putative ATP-dependent endonuclease of OLD family